MVRKKDGSSPDQVVVTVSAGEIGGLSGFVYGLRQLLVTPKRLLAGLAVVLLLAVIVVLGVSNFKSWWNTKDLAFQVGNQKITKAQLNTVVAAAAKDKVSAHVAEQSYIVVAQQLAALHNLSIEVPEDQLNSVAQSGFNAADFSKLNAWQQLQAQKTAIAMELNLAKSGIYEGYVFYFPFNFSLALGYAGATKPAGFGDTSVLASNKAYAQAQATSYKKAIDMDTITPQAALKKVLADPRLIANGSLNDSFLFRTNLNGTQQLNGDSLSTDLPADVTTALKTLTKNGTTTSIGTESTDYPPELLAPGFATHQETQYYFVYLSQKMTSRPTVITEFTTAEKKLKVVEYVKS